MHSTPLKKVSKAKRIKMDGNYTVTTLVFIGLQSRKQIFQAGILIVGTGYRLLEVLEELQQRKH